MLEAAWWAFAAASSLLLGALIALARPLRRRTLGLVLAFGSGVLISAVSFELVQEAVQLSGGEVIVSTGYVLGALTFFAGDTWIDRKTHVPSGGSGDPAGIVLGAVLDGIPESVVIGLSVLSGQVSAAVVLAVFLSNVPEAAAATADLARRGGHAGPVLAIWAVVVVASTIAAALGYAALGDASPSWIAGVNAFAAGAILTMLSDSMMPQAYGDTGKAAGLATAFGFAVAAALSLRT